MEGQHGQVDGDEVRLIVRRTNHMPQAKIPAAGPLGDAMRSTAGDLAIRTSYARHLEQEYIAIDTEQADWIVLLIQWALPYICTRPRSERHEEK